MRILVIEDSSNHLADAKALLEADGHEVFTEKSLMNLGQYFPSENWGGGLKPASIQVDGVISDIHFPYTETRGRSAGSQDYTSNETPCGLSVAMQCERAEMPFVLCTDGSHHSNKLEWINNLCNKMGWALVDGVYDPGVKDIYTQPYPKKDWEAALKALAQRIKRKMKKESENG